MNTFRGVTEERKEMYFLPTIPKSIYFRINQCDGPWTSRPLLIAPLEHFRAIWKIYSGNVYSTLSVWFNFYHTKKLEHLEQATQKFSFLFSCTETINYLFWQQFVYKLAVFANESIVCYWLYCILRDFVKVSKLWFCIKD